MKDNPITVEALFEHETTEDEAFFSPTCHPEAERTSLTISELSNRWNCSERTIHRKLKGGTLNFFRVGWRYLIPLSEIERIERGDS